MEEFLKKIGALLRFRPKVSPTIPFPLIFLSAQRSGLSALNIAMKVLAKKKELGLPVGNYEDGSANANDLMWLAFAQATVSEIQENGKITVVIPPGTQLIASGGNAGGPIVVYGTTTTPTTGYAVMQ